MSTEPAYRARRNPRSFAAAIVGTILLSAGIAQAKPEIRQAFFEVYPGAVGTPIETVPSNANHCGVCHYRFNGGGTRNPYGVTVQNALGNFPSDAQGLRDAIASVQNADPDGDNATSLIEVTDLINYTNTPTFPGLTPALVGNVSQVDLADIQDYLVPSAGGDTTPPAVTLVYPNGGESLTANQPVTVQWTATDDSGISGVSLYVSLDDGATFSPVALNLANSGSNGWFPANRPTALARFRVEAIDNAFNTGSDDSDNVFTIASPPGGIVPTTLRDFDMPGSQPFEAGILNPPEACAVCHGNYDETVEPYYNWQGSMMANASLDPLFMANMVIANQDAPDSGDLCLRCHISRGWLRGRSVPTDGSAMLAADNIGVACDLCHRLVNTVPDPQNPAEDTAILAALSFPGPQFGNGMYVVDPTGARRGPFVNAASGHPVLVSPFHREAALCGTCHDVSNPAFEKDENGDYVPNAFDASASEFTAHILAPVERTYSEWLNSAYNTPGGVYAPQFGGNKDFVATCQDCHMRDVTGQGCNLDPPVRTDLPLHDMTGGSTWLPGLLAMLFPEDVDSNALAAGVVRARYMLQNAADLAVSQQGSTIKVTVTNNCGHKLPTGYPEGRRIWINVQFFDTNGALLAESGAYDAQTGELSHDEPVKIYEVEPGLDEVTAPLVGVSPGPSFHFVLNNKIFKDNRIPPRGFTNAAFAQFGGSPVGHAYADAQYWDDTLYDIPPDASSVGVTLYYQSTSKEFVEFLRDENTTDSQGQQIYDLWNTNGKCPPEVMGQVRTSLSPPLVGDYDNDGDVDLTDYAGLPPCLAGPGGVATGVCLSFDHDGDDDVDEVDYAAFQLAFTGASDATPPATPTGLSAEAGNAIVLLNWNDNTEPDLAGYNLYRAAAPGGPYALVNPLPLSSSEYDDLGVTNGTTYYYLLTAVDTSDNESADSNIVSATPAAPAMHVAAIVLQVQNVGGGNKVGVATVTIVDSGGNPVGGADVSGTFTGDFDGTLVETTDPTGAAVLSIGPVSGGSPNFTFCVDDVTHAAFTYDSGANVETCDSI